MKKMLLLTSLITVCTTIACGNEDDYYIKFDQKEFDEQRLLWQNANHKNYTYKLDHFSSASGPQFKTIEVQNGEVINSDDNDGMYSYTIDDIFKKIEDDLREAKNFRKKDINGVTLSVSYNSQYHYPEKIYYSVSYKTDIVGGGHYELEVKEFKLN